MSEPDLLTERFEEQRPRLRAVAYRMLGSMGDADDAVQEAWLRVSRADSSGVENLAGWLTTVVARVSLNMLRARSRRPEEPLEFHLPDPILSREPGSDPEHETMLADSVGLALMVVLESLSPAERLAFVLHDMFHVSYDEIGPMIERTPGAARQLASRARRRVSGAAPVPDPDLARQREVVDAFLAAAREGDFQGLVDVLHPDVVLRSDGGRSHPRLTRVITGANEVATRAATFGKLAPLAQPAVVNGVAGVLTMAEGRPLSLMAFTVADGRIAAIDVLSDPDRLAALVGSE